MTFFKIIAGEVASDVWAVGGDVWMIDNDVIVFVGVMEWGTSNAGVMVVIDLKKFGFKDLVTN